MVEVTKEQRIQAIMEVLHVSRGEAEFIYAMETGEVDGDIVIVDEEATDDETSDEPEA